MRESFKEEQEMNVSPAYSQLSLIFTFELPSSQGKRGKEIVAHGPCLSKTQT